MMIILLLLLLVGVVVVGQAVPGASTTTPTTPLDRTAHLATSTPYRPGPGSSSASTSTTPSHCRLVQVNMVLRHGTRHPTQGTIRAAADLAAGLQGVLAPQAGAAPAWLMGWRPRFNADLAGELTAAGMIEHYQLAQRLAVRHPDVFGRPYRETRCRLRSTQKSRAGRSASAFAIGLWHGTGQVTAHRFEPTFISTTGPLDDDPILRPFDRCPRYALEKRSAQTTQHARLYLDRVSARIAVAIEQRLGLRLDPALIGPIWRVMRAEVSALGASNLTLLFDDDDVLDLELADDIAAYWTKGPGHDLNWRIMGPLLSDLIESMRDAVRHPHRHRHLDLRFAHAETIIPLVASLGLFQDPWPLTSDSDAIQVRSRQWRMSHISPYAANIAFHLYRCANDEFRVAVVHNEAPVRVGFCDDDDLCPWPSFVAHLHAIASNCNLTDICSMNGSDSDQTCPAHDGDSWSRSSGPWMAALQATTIGLAMGALAGFVLIYQSRNSVMHHDRLYDRLVDADLHDPIRS